MRTTDAGEDRISNGEEEPQAGLPYWVVGLGLMGLVIVLLVGAFVLDRQFRPRVGMEPPITLTVEEPRLANIVSATTTVGSVPLAEPSSTPTAMATSTPTPTAIALPPGPQGSTETPLEREIEAAYLRYWDVYSDALYNLDPSRLPEVMAGAELIRERQQIADLKLQGKAAKILVEHSIAFLKVSEDYAELYDVYYNKSYLVDTVNKQPIQTPGPGGFEKLSFKLMKINGVWKVIDGTRYD